MADFFYKSSEPGTVAVERERPTMASHRLDLPSRCDICGKARSTRKHQACSRIRQQHKSAEWASFMASVKRPNKTNRVDTHTDTQHRRDTGSCNSPTAAKEKHHALSKYERRSSYPPF